MARTRRGSSGASARKDRGWDLFNAEASYADSMFKTALGDKVKDVRVTYRLTDSPSCLVSDEHDPSGNLARMLKAAGQPVPNSKPILEINPQHPAVMRLKYEESRFDDWAALLFEQATLAEGGQLDDPAGFVKRINDLMMALSGK